MQNLTCNRLVMIPKIEHFREILVVWFSVFAANLQSIFARLSVRIETAILPGFFSSKFLNNIETCNRCMQSEFQSLKKFMCISSNSRRILPVLLSLNHILLYFVFVLKLKSSAVKLKFSQIRNEATIIKLGNKRQWYSRIWTKLVGFVNWISHHEINWGAPKNINLRYAYRNLKLSEIREIEHKVDYTIEKLSDTEIKSTNYSIYAIKCCTTKPFETSIGNKTTTTTKMAKHPLNFPPLHT